MSTVHTFVVAGLPDSCMHCGERVQLVREVPGDRIFWHHIDGEADHAGAPATLSLRKICEAYEAVQAS